MLIKTAVLTISDSCSRGSFEDRSGPALKTMAETMGWLVSYYKIIPDDKEEIKTELLNLCDAREVSLVLTTGGTGAGPRDVTPEATEEVLEKELRGVSELIRSKGYEKTPYAVLSRGVAGIRKESIIINLPGSVKGASESFEIVSGLIPHTLSMMKGDGH